MRKTKKASAHKKIMMKNKRVILGSQFEKKTDSRSTYLIFVTSTTSGACGEKSVMWNFFFNMTDCHVEKFLHMRNVKKICHIEKYLCVMNVEQNVLYEEMWRNLSYPIINE